MKKVVRFLYSFWNWLAVFTVMFIACAFALVLGPFLGPKRLNPFLAWCMGIALRATFCKLKVVVHPDFDKERASIFCMNHVSVMDGHVASFSIPQPFTGLMLAWHFKIPAYGWIMKFTRGIPVYSKKSGRFAEVAAAARNRMEMGLGILTFPEGHRTTNGKTKPFRKGMFFLARDAGMPIVPLAAHGLADFNHKPQRTFSRVPITIFIGPQADTEGISDDEVSALTERTFRYVEYCVENGEFPPNDSALTSA
ncbi:MAG: 1-acyl-sn-glycerol-3-phosphate acyltransferase [Myxococcota bacterium]|jgi:1-acyl-sn-glycerol-3-phosphate acyltransferase